MTNNPPGSLAEKYALIDLHLHLDGSLTAHDVLEMARLGGNTADLPTSNPAKLAKLLACPDNNPDLTEYLRCFDLPEVVMQCHDSIAYSVKSLVKRLHSQRLLYAEIRFAPQQHTKKGLTQRDVVQAAVDGLNQGLNEAEGFRANLILCCKRGLNNHQANYETIDVTRHFLHQGVVAADIAGAEALFPTADYSKLFGYARQLGVPVTIHAGEAAGTDSINAALDFGALRIGHGVACHTNPDTMKRIRQMGVCLDICPKSNLDTHAINGVDSYENYPLPTILAAGVPVTINTDNMTVSGISLRQEFDSLLNAGAITPEQAEQIVLCSISHAFTTETEKLRLREKALAIMHSTH